MAMLWLIGNTCLSLCTIACSIKKKIQCLLKVNFFNVCFYVFLSSKLGPYLVVWAGLRFTILILQLSKGGNYRCFHAWLERKKEERTPQFHSLNYETFSVVCITINILGKLQVIYRMIAVLSTPKSKLNLRRFIIWGYISKLKKNKEIGKRSGE